MREKMMRFNRFLTESQSAIQSATVVANALPSFDVVDTKYVKETGKRITITQTMPDAKRRPYVQAANNWLQKNKDGFEYIEIKSNRATKDIHFKSPNSNKEIYIQTKPDGKRGSTDPNELMTAVLACIPRLTAPKNLEELDAMVDSTKALVSSKISDYAQNELDAFDGDYTNFCQAISAAIAIQDFMGGTADRGYITGRVWHRDIQKFKMNSYGMKDFNSSDIVLKRGKQFYGISLKKKDRTTTADPTILNKSVSSVFTDKNLIDSYNDAIRNFMINRVIAVAERAKMLQRGSKRKAELDRTGKVWKNLISRLDNAYFNRQLKGRFSIFSDIAALFDKEADMIADTLMQLVLKTDLQKLKAFDFDFALVTGIGNYGPRIGPVVSKADLIGIDTIVDRMATLAQDNSPKIQLDRSTIQPGNRGATAAVLKMNLMMGTMKMLDITIRYKGSSSWTSQPSILATMTREFKDYLKGK